MSLKLIAKGDRSAGTADLTAAAGDAVNSTGNVHWQHQDGSTAITTNLSVVGPGLPDKPQVTATLKGSAQDVALPMLGDKAPPPGPVTISAKLGMDRNGKL